MKYPKAYSVVLFCPLCNFRSMNFWFRSSYEILIIMISERDSSVWQIIVVETPCNIIVWTIVFERLFCEIPNFFSFLKGCLFQRVSRSDKSFIIIHFVEACGLVIYRSRIKKVAILSFPFSQVQLLRSYLVSWRRESRSLYNVYSSIASFRRQNSTLR